jgi:hypothetical protein
MSLLDPNKLSGPIPGENITSDTRNYPWHRPPDITDLDEAIEYVLDDLTDTNLGLRSMAMLKTDVSVATVTDIIVTTGIGRGKWTPDFAILMAGPVARLLTIMAKQYGIDYTMGLDSGEGSEQAMLAEIINASPQKMHEVAMAVEAEAAQMQAEEGGAEDGGLMAPAPADEQAVMLGYGAEEEAAPEDMPEEEI